MADMRKNFPGIASLLAGALALAIAVYAHMSFAMNDGDRATPGFFFSITAFFSYHEPPASPSMSASPVFLMLDTDKQQIASVIASMLAILAFLAGMASRRQEGESLLHASGMLAGLSAITIFSAWAGLLAATVTVVALVVIPGDQSKSD